MIGAVWALSCGAPEAKVLIENQSGAELRDLVLDYEVGQLEYQIFCEGCTHSGMVDVSTPRPLSIEYVDETGIPQRNALEKKINASMDGKNVIIRIEPDGTVKEYY